MTRYDFKENIELQARILDGEATTQEISSFNEWLNEDVENRAFWSQLQEEFALQNAAMVGAESNTDQAWIAVEQRLKLSMHNKPSVKQLKPSTRIFAYVSAAAVLAVVTLFTLSYFNTPVTKDMLVATSRTQIQEITLDDGSLVTVNGSSEFKHPSVFGQKERAVVLKGEAFFSVAKDAQKPFVVRTNNLIIKVLGTQFNVKDYGASERAMQVSVAEGRVEVRSKENMEYAVVIMKGEEVILDARSGALMKATSVNVNYLAWKTKVLTFENSSLKEVFETLSDVYKVDFKMDDNRFMNKQLTASFNQKDINFVMKVISSTFNFNYSIDNEVVTIQ